MKINDISNYVLARLLHILRSKVLILFLSQKTKMKQLSAATDEI